MFKHSTNLGMERMILRTFVIQKLIPYPETNTNLENTSWVLSLEDNDIFGITSKPIII